MTNEEAIAVLQGYIDNPLITETKAFEVAIEALERIPSYEAGYNDAKMEIALSGEYERAYKRGKADARAERDLSCEDCISREDFIAKVKDIYYGYMLDDDGCCPQDFVDLAEEMPFVTPQPKTGQWITHNESITLLTGETATGGVLCSECGYKTHNKAHVLVGCPFKYCPNCGAKMEAQE